MVLSCHVRYNKGQVVSDLSHTPVFSSEAAVIAGVGFLCIAPQTCVVLIVVRLSGLIILHSQTRGPLDDHIHKEDIF